MLQHVQSSFARAKVLIEANCADCAGDSREALEQGIDLAMKAMNAGYPDRAAVLRLLVDAYGTLGVVFLKPNTPERDAAFQHRQDTLQFTWTYNALSEKWLYRKSKHVQFPDYRLRNNWKNLSEQRRH